MLKHEPTTLKSTKVYIAEFFKEGNSMAYRVVVVMKGVRSRRDFSCRVFYYASRSSFIPKSCNLKVKPHM